MWARRVLALAGAIGLVLVAVVVRAALDDGSGNGSNDRNGGPGTTATSGPAEGPVRLVCPTDLAARCEQAVDGLDVAVTATDPGAQADLFSSPGADPVPAVWLTPQGWLDVAADRNQRQGLELPTRGDPIPLARSPLVLVGWSERLAALAGCPEGRSLTCLGDIAGTPWADAGGEASWGRVRPGHAEPAGLDGPAALSSLAGAYFGTTDIASNDFDTTAEGRPASFRDWFTSFEQAVPDFSPSSGSPLAAMLQLGPASFDAALTTEAEALDRIPGSREEGRLRVLYPAPMVTTDLVLAGVGLDVPDGLDKRLRDALADAGWRTDEAAPAGAPAGAPNLSKQSGLLRPGVLDALVSLQAEVTG